MSASGDLGYGWLGEPNAASVAFAAWAEARKTNALIVIHKG